MAQYQNSLWRASTFLSLALSSFAAPTPEPVDSFKLHQVANDLYNEMAPIMAVDKAYRKFSWPKPDGLSSAAQTAQEKISTTSSGNPAQNAPENTYDAGKTVGSITVTPQPYNSEYLAPITVGGQLLYLDIDTGSSDLWVFNSAMGSQAGTHRLYDPSKSRTYAQGAGETFSFSYGDKDSLSGNVGRDGVQIGGLYVANQAIELPTTVSPDMVTDAADGILGLGFQSINSIYQGSTASPQPTWFENVLPQLRQPLFTVNLKVGTAGKYNFGTIDETAYKAGTMQYVPVDSSGGYWGFASTDYAIGSGSVQTNSASRVAIADTGSSLMFVDPAVHNAFYANVAGKSVDSSTGMTTFPCSETLPDFHVAIGDQMATIPGHLLNWKPDTAAGMCVGGIQSNGGNPPQVYGDILFQVYYFVFNYETKQLGFAPHA